LGFPTLSEIFRLPVRERAQHYRARAHETRVKAAHCTGDIRAGFFKIAGYWEQLALEAEADAKEEAAHESSEAQRETNQKSNRFFS
jgi:hypothetical protein